MIVQRIAYPSGATLEEELYVRRNTSSVAVIGEHHTIEAISGLNDIRFDTYFNTFSIKKWRKYTNINNVKLEIEIKGRARVALTSLEIHGFDVDETIVYSEIVTAAEKTKYCFAYPTCTTADALCFRIRPLEEGVCIYNGAYVSDVAEDALNEVNLSLAICTYRREDYVTGNMAMLQKEVFDNKESMLHGHIHVYISDNGNTLDPEQFTDPHIHLFENKNSGGSGGFSRGAIEAINDNSHPTSHVILMDDDINFDQYALERTYMFLRLLKSEYAVSLLGGAMFRTDRRAIQHAAGETHDLNGITFNKAGYNMYNIVDIMRNEVEERINYLGWWYCSIPVDLFKQCKYSLPLFVQYDDIEFSLRNKDVPKITLNGICCWHIPFDKKWSGFKNYYTIRNKAIVNSMYFDGFTKKYFKRELKRECVRRTLQYSYNEANLALLAAEDFLKGMPWLIQQDPKELNTKVISLSDKLLPVDQLSIVFDPRKLKRNGDVHWERKRTFLRRLSLNGWLLPATRTKIIEVDNPPLQHLFLAKKVLKYDLNTDKGIVVEKSYKEAIAIMVRLIKVCFLLDRKFDAVVAEYKNMHDEVITEEFWKKFLNF